MDHTFAELVSLISEKKEVWVALANGINICLIAVADEPTQLFMAKYLPCAKNSRVYQIRYNQIKSLGKKPGGWEND